MTNKEFITEIGILGAKLTHNGIEICEGYNNAFELDSLSRDLFISHIAQHEAYKGKQVDSYLKQVKIANYITSWLLNGMKLDDINIDGFGVDNDIII